MLMVLVGLVFFGLTLVPLTLTLWLLVYAARAATTAVGHCRQCGYDLHGLETRCECPECGMAFRVNEDGVILSGGSGK